MQTIKELLPAVLTHLQSPVQARRQMLTTKWAKIAGPRIAPHTRPSLTKDGKLYVWVDQSPLAFELNQRYKNVFLKRVQGVVGPEHIHAIYFRVGQLR